MKKTVIALLLCSSFAFPTDPHSDAAEPGWSIQVIATGELRDEIQTKPIEQRPYRPLHFYGNAVRRRHYRGTALPVPRQFVNRRVFRW
jgi:hypothetical protein